jgi:putative two-component system response regulator
MAQANIPLILLVDDEDEILEMYAAKLQEADYEIVMAHDGYEAIDAAKEDQPDLILLDIMMPGLSGTETLLKLKENPATADIPVAFLSSLPETADEVATAKTAGAADFISKDIELDSFVQRVEKVLSSAAAAA